MATRSAGNWGVLPIVCPAPFIYGENTTSTGGDNVLEEGYNPYESNVDSGYATYAPRRRAHGTQVRSHQNRGTQAPSIKAPSTAASIREFDFAAAMFADDNAWRELARVIASDAA